MDFEVFIKELEKYQDYIKNIIPIEEELNDLKRKDYTYTEIYNKLGYEKIQKLRRIPKILYHGSKNELNVILANESSQKGKHVYATDNPLIAFFFSVFRKTSQARAVLEESYKDGIYSYKVLIDERVKNTLQEVIKDETITIHTCEGSLFFKPFGEKYTTREWISKNNQDIIPISKYTVNIKDVIKYLEEKNIISYSYFNKDKNWETVIEMLSENYTYGLETKYGRKRRQYDKRYSDIIKKYFPEQYEFSYYFRKVIKRIMDEKIESKRNYNEIIEYKIKKIKKIANSLLLEGPNYRLINKEKLEQFLNENRTPNNVNLVGIMIFKNNKLLVVKNPKNIKYQMIGGKQEQNESILETAIREMKSKLKIKEELNPYDFELVLDFNETSRSNQKQRIHFYAFKYKNEINIDITELDTIIEYDKSNNITLSNTLEKEIIPYCIDNKLIK